MACVLVIFLYPDPVTNQRGEIDISDSGYQIPGTTNGVSEIISICGQGGKALAIIRSVL